MPLFNFLKKKRYKGKLIFVLIMLQMKLIKQLALNINILL